MRRIGLKQFAKAVRRTARPFHENYYAMYSSVYGGIVTDPVLMTIPIDDHMVHRGDGIFEVMKCVNGCIYNLGAHLKRLGRTAKALAFRIPVNGRELTKIIVETIRAGGRRDCYIHLYVSRGPGSFGVNPYDCPETQVYVVVTKARKPFMDEHPDGAVVRTSSIAVKPVFYAGVKSCNYLPNVLMKREAQDLGVDFVVAFTEKGHMAEGATENFGIVTPGRDLLFPRLDGILEGTTMVRVMQLAESLLGKGVLARIGFADIARKDVVAACEMLVVGTTPNVTKVRKFDGKAPADWKRGPVYTELARLLNEDIAGCRAMRTRAF